MYVNIFYFILASKNCVTGNTQRRSRYYLKWCPSDNSCVGNYGACSCGYNSANDRSRCCK